MIDIFTENLPHLDLHGEDRINALIKVDEFINDNIKLRNKRIVIIHGIGTGILRNSVHEYLKKDKRVEEYILGINNGQTIVSLKFDK
ncbi:MAG: Smr/MutS family protein [Bacilli bacterium]|nr:Smr/MutS family protein [Bacilli bacterium]